MILEPLGDTAWRIELPEGANRPAIQAFLRAQRGVVDVVVTDRHALVVFDPAEPPDDPRRAIESMTGATIGDVTEHVVRVRYDGDDLPDVARAIGRSIDDVIVLHAGTYTVELIGFLPGFAYLGELPSALHLPRRSTPRPRVPALAVGIAMQRTAVYPFASPGGWHLIGHALDFRPFDAIHGARLRLGDRVRFVPA